MKKRGGIEITGRAPCCNICKTHSPFGIITDKIGMNPMFRIPCPATEDAGAVTHRRVENIRGLFKPGSGEVREHLASDAASFTEADSLYHYHS